MSRVRLRSRNYKLSANDIDKISFNFEQKRKLRNAIVESSILKNDLNIPNDKTSESSAVETCSSNSQTEYCHWDGCDFEAGGSGLHSNSSSDMLELHLLQSHVRPQFSGRRRHVECRWIGCKVYRCASLSHQWLERHIIEHTDNKHRPYACVMLHECKRRFATVQLLERHINRDHNLIDQVPSSRSRTTTTNGTPHHHKPPHMVYHVHRNDFINSNTFSSMMTSYSTSAGDDITNLKVIGSRTLLDGSQQSLVEPSTSLLYHGSNIYPHIFGSKWVDTASVTR